MGHAAADDLRDIDVVLERLDEIVAWSIEHESRVGYFATLYRQVTAGVREAIVDGRFNDGARMARFDRIFADLFVAAFDAWRAGEPVSESWQVAFAATSKRRLLILQHLLLGMNAHINLDLAIATAEVMPAERDDRPGFKEDFDEINEVLGSRFADLEERVGQLSPWIAWLDRLGGRVDDEVIKFSIVVARANAWEMAVELTDPDKIESPAEIVERYDNATAALGKVIARPGRFLEFKLLLIRLREEGDVARAIRVLS